MLKDVFAKYHQSLAFAESSANISFRKNFGRKRRDPSFFLDRTRYFLDLLGHPDRGLEYIHVTGTAGKGTVSTMLQNVLTEAGEKAGLFTSPYVTSAIEEIRVGDLYISPCEFAGIMRYLKPFIAKAALGPFGAPSRFEIFLAVALIYFKSQKCKWVVLEVGLGGRFDATNVIAKPAVTAITNIDYDHTEILGKTLKEIAYDKAGIVKRSSTFFTSEQRPGLLAFFRSECKKKGAAFHFVGKNRNHRDRNALLVSQIATHLGIPRKAIDLGMKKTRLPCRFEVMQKSPFVVLDGAHNRAKIASVMANLAGLEYGRLIVIVGIANLRKDNKAILGPLVSGADRMILTSFGSAERMGIHPRALLPLALKLKHDRRVKISTEEDPEKALKLALKEADKRDCVLVVGSFFLAGKLRERWYPEAWVLKNRKSF